MRWVLLALILAGGASLAAQGAEPGFSRHSLPLVKEFGDLVAFDLTGNKRLDLITVQVDREYRDAPPVLAVYLHTENGFREAEAARSRLPASLTAIAVGNFPNGPGLVLLMPDSVELRPWRNGRFDSFGGTWAKVESIFPKAGGELKAGLQMVADLEGDGIHEIIVPRVDGLQIFRVGPNGELTTHAVLRTRTFGRLLRLFRWKVAAYQLPVFRFKDIDGNGWKDVVAFNRGVLQLFFLDPEARPEPRPPDLAQDMQPPVPFDPSAPRDPPLLLVNATDLNGDGVLDLVFSKTSATDSAFTTNTRTLIYYGKNEGGRGNLRFAARPNQVYASEGFAHPIMVDINRDGRSDLVLVNVEIGFWNAIKAFVARTVTAEASFFLMKPEGRYGTIPDDLIGYSVKFSLGRFGHQPISVFGDVNGDGLPDLLLSENKETLGIHWGRSDGFWESENDSELTDFLPIHRRRVKVLDLNGDGRDDLIFAYNRDDIRKMPTVNGSFTVLLSRYGQTP